MLGLVAARHNIDYFPNLTFIFIFFNEPTKVVPSGSSDDTCENVPVSSGTIDTTTLRRVLFRVFFLKALLGVQCKVPIGNQERNTLVFTKL